MSVAEKAAVPNFSQIRGKIRLVTALAVMGILIAMAPFGQAMAMGLRIDPKIARSIARLLLSKSVLQPGCFSIFPSLFLINMLIWLSPDSRGFLQHWILK